jgi:hypothetical protein
MEKGWQDGGLLRGWRRGEGDLSRRKETGKWRQNCRDDQ